jgi:hypothetical protein
VLEPGGRATFVTPNRLTFGRPDEIIDPYHEVEYDRDQLRALCAPYFETVEVRGLFGSSRYLALLDEQRAQLDALLRIDPLRLRRLLWRSLRRRLYDRRLTTARMTSDPRAEAITPGDFTLACDGLDRCLDVIAVCSAAAAA